MVLSSSEEYGLRCALQLARMHASRATVLAASEIAEREGISLQYVSKFMHLFRKAGLVEATRGIQGGFRLARAPEKVSLHDVLQAIRVKKPKSKKTEAGNFCSQYAGLQDQCVHYGECSIRPVWMVLSVYFDGLLQELTLSDLLHGETKARDKVIALVAGKARQPEALHVTS